MNFKLINLSIFVACLMAFANVGCGRFGAAKDSGLDIGAALAAKPFGTCDRKSVPTINLCMEAIGSDYNEAGYLQILESSCTSTGGVFSVSNCDRSMGIGSCIVAAGQTNEAHVTYYPPEYTAQSAKTACEATPDGVYIAN